MAERSQQIENRRSLQDSQYSHDRAEEVRLHVGQVKEREIQGLWLRVIEGHDRQTALLERLPYGADKSSNC
jgi:hypothetical protein